MKYYICEREFDGFDSLTARGKAREDAEKIVKREGYMPIEIDVPDRSSYSIPKKILWQFRIIPYWKKNLKHASKGDELFIQFPFREHSVFLPLIMRRTAKRGVRITMLVHDLEKYRCLREQGRSVFDKVKCYFDAKSLKYANKLILHNKKMIEAAKKDGLNDTRMYELGIFDYLCEVSRTGKRGLNEPVVIAGNLTQKKSGFAYDLPSGTAFNLYGPGYEGGPSDLIDVKGKFSPEELPSVIDGSFGLVWDGSSADTCDGVFGKYLKINAPHKTSLYLASGLPVIIWKEAAMADFIKQNGLGITIDSISEIPPRIKLLSDRDYEIMLQNVNKISGKIRTGFYLKSALEK